MNMYFELQSHLVTYHQLGRGWESNMRQNIIDGCILTQAGFQIDALFWLDESQFENYVKQNQFFGTNGMKIKLKEPKMSLWQWQRMLEAVFCKANGVMYLDFQNWHLFVWEEFQEKTIQVTSNDPLWPLIPIGWFQTWNPKNQNFRKFFYQGCWESKLNSKNTFFIFEKFQNLILKLIVGLSTL